MKTKLLIAALLIINYCSAQYTKLHDFASTANGGYPSGSLISDGNFLYGTTAIGGINNDGVIFKIKPDGTGYSELFDFDSINGKGPNGSLFSDGIFLYGTTYQGGINNMGTIFKIKSDGSGYFKVFDFDSINGSAPNGSLISDGAFLYGMTWKGGTNNYGTIFKIKPDGTTYTKLLDLTDNNGGHLGSLISDGTFLYGTTNSNIFKIKLDGTAFSTLHEFGSGTDGNGAYGSLISDGIFLYGMTAQGGTNNWGTIFKIKPDGSGYARLRDFGGSPDGAYPTGSLIFDGTFLYGMTTYGGTYICVWGNGTIFKIKPDGTNYNKLFDFVGTGDGAYPSSSLISDSTFLYGMAPSGGSNIYGVIFKLGLATGITKYNDATSISIYPNPSNGVFQVSSVKYKISNMEVYNVLGEKIYQSETNNLKEGIDLSNQPNGIYFISLKTEQGIVSKKIIINK